MSAFSKYKQHWQTKSKKRKKKRTLKSIKKINKALKRNNKRLSFKDKPKNFDIVKESNGSIQKFADLLNKYLPKSEVWFHTKWNRIKGEERNRVFKGDYIPDIVNHKYKYIIEIDDPSHNRPYVIKKDLIKNDYYINNGYMIFRIIPFVEKNIKLLENEVNKYLKSFKKPVITRKKNGEIKRSDDKKLIKVE